MTEVSLPPDATIAFIGARLRDPVEYLRRVLANMAPCNRACGVATVRISMSGVPTGPHYLVEPQDCGEEQDAEADAEQMKELRAVFHGNTHKPLSWTSKKIDTHGWSDHLMTYEEVKRLLGEWRGYKPRLTLPER